MQKTKGVGGLRKIKACSSGAHEILGSVFETLLDENYLVLFSGLTKVDFQRRLRKDDIGICVFPTIHAPSISRESKPAESKRGEKKVRKYAFLCNEYVSIVLQCISS